MNLLNIRDIQCGFDYTLILTDKMLLVFGYNNFGQLGTEDNENKLVPTESKIENAKNIKAIFCGGRHTMIFMNNGDLFVCADNRESKLGLGYLIDAYNRWT